MSGTVKTEKTPVTASRGMITANHPLASAAGIEMMAAGGNAVDATVAALFVLSVVEPAMVGVVGGGTALIRLADGREVVLDGMCQAPLAAHEHCYVPLGDSWPLSQETEGEANRVGVAAVATPGNLMAWCEAVGRYGRLSLADVIEPAIRHAARGFTVTPTLAGAVEVRLDDILRDAAMSAIFLPGGEPLRAGMRLVQDDYAATLRAIAREGAAALHGGELGRAVAGHVQANGGMLDAADLEAYRMVERAPVRAAYRDHEVIGVPPPCSGGASVAEILNILEGWDIGGMGFGSARATHLLMEAMKAATADRDASLGDPDFFDVPLGQLMSKDYAATRRAGIAEDRAGPQGPGLRSVESANTTHVTAADGDGNIVVSTQTINSSFGACTMAPGTGAVLNNYMYVFNPLPGLATSIAPGKRITGNIAATIVARDGRPVWALGLPGGYKIPSVVAQVLVNLIDHSMTVQQAVEAPRVFAKGPAAEVETDHGAALAGALTAMGHPVRRVDAVAGCMGAIAFAPDGAMTGASCWRGDGVPAGFGGGLARADIVFWPDPTGRPGRKKQQTGSKT
ncbi:MAG: gamma-glutamyltransferase [Rhodobacteraceae bacterium]|nr:gamma-glutamyltransferase [Paracoccaceae bacterium]